jgi:PII-like signaling protein
MRSLEGEQILLRLIVSESLRHEHQPVFRAILTLLRQEGLAGATVLRGMAGFGHDRRLHTADIEVASFDLPVVIEVVDTAERIDGLLPRLGPLMQGGVMMTERAHVIRYTTAEPQA